VALVPRESPLRAEIRQGRPFSSPQQEAVLGLLRAADVVRRRLSAAVQPQGITLQQYNVLRILRGAGSAGLPTLDIAARMIEQAPGITRLLDRLRARGLVRRRRCPHDRRQVLCFITANGLSLLGSLDPLVTSLDRVALSGMRGRRVHQLIRLLDAVRAGGRGSRPSRKKEKNKEIRA
jgi:DNA-binding MarR family transcriptional regulator